MFTAATTAQFSSWWNNSATPPVGQVVVANSINYAYAQYSQSSISYVGPDSSNRPVFFFPYANASNQLRAVLFRIEDNGLITQGAEQSAGTQSCYRAVQCMSEYEGANSFSNGTPTNHVYMAYVDSGLTTGYGQVATVDVNALTCTFGTAAALTGTPDGDFAVVAYVGDYTSAGSTKYNAVFGIRTGTGMYVTTYQRTGTGTSLSSIWNASSDLGYRIDPAQLGFAMVGSPGQFRSAYWDTGSGASGTIFGAASAESVITLNQSDSTSITTSNKNFGCNLNNTDKFLGSYYDTNSASLKVAAVQATWTYPQGFTPPSLSLGSSQTIANYSSSTGTAWFPVSGFSTDTAYVLLNDTTTSLSYIPITVSGTSTSVGSRVSIFNNLSNINYDLTAASAKIGTKTYFAGIQPRTSGNPYIYGLRLS